MALNSKDHIPNDSTTMAIIQASAFYDHNFGGPSLVHASKNSSRENIYGMDDHQKSICQEPKSLEKACGPAKNFTMSNSSSVSSPSSTNSDGLGYQATAYNLSEEGHSVISLKPEYGDFLHSSGSLLSFEQTKRVVPRNVYTKMIGNEDEYPIWEEDLYPSSYQSQLINPMCTTTTTNHGLAETSSSHHATTGYGAPSSGVHFAWLSDQEANTINNGIQELGRQETSNNKRPSTGESMQALKKQCAVASSNCASKKAKPKTESPSKDPQSIAAKNRRERISERLKVLQELVPNGSKVDLVTMLEKAISYVKFLQLQVKVLATDEFWPAQGGKAPDLSQVKEAIDAILASQRDRRNSSSK
ncbi:hypothetical protein Pfo_019266 [Paulownia fortunei]|nr:hypothetical protein Pfo_019266 [Paulownia fortunei]